MLNSSSTSSFVLLFRNEDKLVAPLVYFFFRRKATSGFRNFSIATSYTVESGNLCLNEEWIRTHSVFSRALQHGIGIRKEKTSPD